MPHTVRDRLLRAFPAGSNGEFDFPPEAVCAVRRGEGCWVETCDGDRMVDFSMGWGSVLLGHADPRVSRAVAARLVDGTNFAAVTDASLRLAERLIELSPACERVRFAASGTEATMYCLRLARAATGRSAVLRFEGAYHGAHDVGVTSMFPAGDRDFPQPEPSSDGLVAHHHGGVLVAPFNDLATTTELVWRHRDALAAVIVEPLQRCLPPAPGFLEGLRGVTQEAGVPLVFDEVVTGFRMARAGAQERYGVVPDLVAYGKALGGGLPIGAFGGAASLMDLAAEHRRGVEPYVWTASTLGGNPLSATAALATLDALGEPGVYDRLYRMGTYLRDGMRRVLHEKGVGARVLGDGPLAQIALTDREPIDYRSSRHRDPGMARRLMLELFSRGVWLNPMGTKLYLSLAHTESDCDVFLAALAGALVACGAAERVPACRTLQSA